MSDGFDLKRLAEYPLTADEAAHIFGEILSGRAEDKEIEAFLIALSARKPAISEFVGAVTAMRAQMKGITAPPLAIDLCGTGGDGLPTSRPRGSLVRAPDVQRAGHRHQPPHVLRWLF